MVDLHTHSTVSDGESSPEELVDRAKAMGLTAIAVSDHDSLEGSARAMRHGELIHQRVIPAVEISASYMGKVLHVVGYFVDPEDMVLGTRLQEVRDYRTNRAATMVGNINRELARDGKSLMDLDAILALGREKPLTRVDLAQVLLDLGHVQSRSEAFDRWLNRFNIPNLELSVADAIAMIHAAHGAAVLAHPGSEYLSLTAIGLAPKDEARVVADFAAQGLDGIEVYRLHHDPAHQERYAAIARDLGIIASGGSDYHGPQNTGSAPDIGVVPVPDETVAALEEAARAY